MTDAKKEFYMLVRKGMVQRVNQPGIGKVWPVTETLEDAKRLARFFKRKGLRPALIGSVPGETLEGHIQMAYEEGCIAIAMFDWDPDGSPRLRTLTFDD